MPRSAHKRRRAVLRAVITSLVSLGVLLLIWRALGHDVRWNGVHLTPLPVVLAVTGALCFLLGRAWRFGLFLRRRGGTWSDVVGLTAASWGAGLLLPGPSADVAFVALARRRLGVGVGRAAGVAVMARILDVVSLCAVAVVAAAATAGESAAVVWSAVVVGIAGVVALALVLFATPRQAILGLLGKAPRLAPLVRRSDAALDELAHAPTWMRLVLSTALCRLATALQYSALFDLVGVHIGFWRTWFALSIRTLLFSVPIQGVAGIGTGQAWWAGALILVGVGAGAAVPAGLTLQAVDLAVSLPVAGVVSLLLLLRRRTSAVPPEDDSAEQLPGRASGERIPAGSAAG